MRIVVTGATSFIGRAVVEELLDKRHQVFAAVRPDSAGRGELETMQRETGGQLTVLPVDGRTCGSIWAGRVLGAPTARTLRFRPGILVMPWRRWGQPRVWAAPAFCSAVPRRSTGLRTVLCARIPPAIRCQSTARTSWRCAAGPGRRPGSWESPICTHGFSAFTVRETIPGPWCPAAWTPF